jgi:YegS/Rv2252/BmrU family lipid kinase
MGADDLPATRRLLVIRNPAAGQRRRRTLEAVTAVVRQRGHTVDIVDTQARGHATRLAYDADAGRYDVIVAAGGDGTISEVVNGLMARPTDDLVFGIIPLGTANVLAREIGLGARAEAIATVLTAGIPTAIGVGEISDAAGGKAHFAVMIGVGFDARVVAGVSDRLKRCLGKGAYIWRSLVEMIAYRDRRYRIEVDGAVHEAASVIVSRGRFYGGSFVVAPRADLRRAALSVCLLERGGRWPIVRYGLALLTGRLPATPGYRVIEADRVRINRPAAAADIAPEPVQVDGDHVASLPVVAAMAPRRLRLLMPST